MELVHLIYCSASKHGELGYSELQSLLAACRANNAKVGVTGALLYRDASFFQVLEGDKPVVETLFERISADHRHSRVMKIIEEPILKRDFGDWSMGFSLLGETGHDDLPGTNHLLTEDDSFWNLGEGRTRKLLAAFKNGMWREHPVNGIHVYHSA